MRAAFRSWMDASLEFKDDACSLGVRDADGGDRKRKTAKRMKKNSRRIIAKSANDCSSK